MLLNFTFMLRLKTFLKKQWSNLLFVVVIILMIIPQTRMPIQVFLQRLIAFSPSEISVEDRSVLTDYKWNLLTLNGSTADFSTSEGKVIVINFWATWCPPCVAEMPSLQSLYDHYGDKVDLYFVSTEEAEKLSSFLQKKEYSFPVYRQIEEAPEAIRTNALPTTYVISKSGTIVINKTGAAAWDSEKVYTLLDELISE